VSVRVSTRLTPSAAKAVANPRRVRVDTARVEALIDPEAAAGNGQVDDADGEAATAA